MLEKEVAFQTSARYRSGMRDIVLRYRGREVTQGNVLSIQALIARHPDASRRRLSALLCADWDWRQPNGALCDMLARSLMLQLHRAGCIELPPKRCSPPNNAVAHDRRRVIVEVDRSPVRCSLRGLGPLTVRQVRRSKDEALFDSLLEEHHYLGYTRPVGEHLKHLVTAGDGRPIACLAWSSAARHLGPRDRFIGWSAEARRRNIRLLAYNTRFLILPWIEVPHLASHLLGRVARGIAADWMASYAHPVYYLETFVDPARFRGTCYRAANWIVLGRTTGLGNNAPDKKLRVSIKEVLGYPLAADFRTHMTRTSTGS
jgi:hypothetical protein